MEQGKGITRKGEGKERDGGERRRGVREKH